MEYYLIVSTVMMFVGIYGFVTRRYRADHPARGDPQL